MPERQIIQIELIILNLFEIITVHVENNQIEIFYLNQEELLSIYYYQIIGYQLVTPVHYVIEEKYLAIVSVKDNLTFIHIFSTNYNSTLKLLDIIQISRLIFFISDYNLYYYDSTQQLMIYDLKYFQIKLNPLRIIPDHSQYSVNISLISSSQKIKNLTKKFTLKLTIKQFCYQILLRTSKITLNSKNLQYRLLNLNKYFYGPIHNLTIDDSSTFTILGPYIINGIIMECNKTSMNKCIYQTQISLNSIFLNLYFFKKEENFYLLNSNKQDNTSIVLQLETELLTFDIDGNFIVVKVYQFDFKNQKKLIQRISKQFQYQGVNNFEQTWSYTGKLVKFLGYNFYISQTDIYLLESVYQNIIYVQGSQKLYLEILWSNKWISNEIEINIYSIEDGQLNLNQVLLMKKSIIIEELHRNEFLSDFSITNFQILSSSLDDNILQIEVLQNNHQFSLISLLIFELNKSIQQYIIKYVLRNPLNDEIKSIECYKNLIILKSYQKNYLFDLREKQIYYDYFSSFILSSKLNDQFDNLSHQIFNQKIKQITTIEDHNDLIFVTEDNEYYYGSIGYIILGNSDKEVQFKLRATNDISSQTLLVTLQADKFLEQILGVLGIMIIIIVFLYFWRRNRLKIQNQEKYGNKINNIYI
ncbi:unnamed protein product [Paramecium sonneborni]|uniref:Transmembrane protein n=1 Tax=Paramecium sonneborni TaxID=65129 RepID=A0A8S1RLW6_9CILI|nr:unnamed protein product [Paramecium sonneborni]